MKKVFIAIATGSIAAIVGTLISDKLLKIDVLGKLSDGLLYFVTGNILIPKWLVSITIPSVLLLILICIYKNVSLLSARKNIVLVRKKKTINTDEIIKSKILPETDKLDVLGYQNNDPTLAYRKNICVKDYEPGTFTLAEINPNARFMKDPTTFSQWFDAVFSEEVEVVRGRYPKLIPTKTNIHELKEKILGILDCKTNTSKSLKQEIWYQEYSDIIRRIMLFCLKGNPDHELDLYPNLTYKRKRITFDLIDFISKNKNPSISDWLNLSIAAGLLGVDEKSVHSATSDINRAHVIPLNKPNEKNKYAVERISSRLWEMSKTENRINASGWLFHIFKLSVGIPFKIVSFSDDYIETIFLLKFYNEVLKEFLHLEIDLVPRSLKCGNDATHDDVVQFLNAFPYLKASSRLRVHKNGPKLGTVNLQKLAPSIMALIEQSDLVDARGARNYEMMQGITKNVCFGFMVCRDFSESVTGINGNKIPLIYLKQSSGEKSFSGFRDRHKNLRDGIMLCSSTAIDQKHKFEGGHLSTYRNWSKEKKERFETIQAFYSKNALDFHKKYGDHLEKGVIDYLNEFKGKVLVVGCGSGKEVCYLDALGCTTTGIDFSFEAISIARSLHPGLWDQFAVEDLYNIKDFKSNSLDGVVSNATLVHLLERKDLRTILAGFKKVLKKDGIGFLRLIEKEGVAEEYDTVLFKNPRWFVYYTINEIETLCDSLNLTVLKKDRVAHVQYEKVYWISVLFKNEN